MFYRLLRGIARLALHIFYRRIKVEGLEYVPADGPVLFVSNHPNALVDPLLPVISLSRRLTLTAKNVLRKNPLRRLLMFAVGVIPFHRREDFAQEVPIAKAAAATAPMPNRHSSGSTDRQNSQAKARAPALQKASSRGAPKRRI